MGGKIAPRRGPLGVNFRTPEPKTTSRYPTSPATSLLSRIVESRDGVGRAAPPSLPPDPRPGTGALVHVDLTGEDREVEPRRAGGVGARVRFSFTHMPDPAAPRVSPGREIVT